MEINEIFSFRHDLGKSENDTCVNSSGMNAMFQISSNFRLSVKFSTHMINSTRQKIGFSYTNYFRSLVVLVFALVTALSKFQFPFPQKQNDHFLIPLDINKKMHFPRFTKILLNPNWVGLFRSSFCGVGGNYPV